MLYSQKISMNKIHIPLLLILVSLISSCSVITGIFKAGAVVGIIGVLVVIAIIIWVISQIRGKN